MAGKVSLRPGAPAKAITAAATTIAQAVAATIADPDLLLWIWPKLAAEAVRYTLHHETLPFPGMEATELDRLRRRLGPGGIAAALDAALLLVLERIAPKPAGRATGGRALATARGPTAAPNLQAEWNALSPSVRGYVDGGFAGYIGIRNRLLDKFGGSADPDAAIVAINAYYGTFVAAEFPKAKFKTPVHPTIKARLRLALDLLAAKGATTATDGIRDVGGFSIRVNVNNHAELSNHSFGTAMDIDAARNPNIGKTLLPLAIITAVTGVDLYGAESRAIAAGGSYDTLVPPARVLVAANAEFTAAFRDAAGLQDGMRKAAMRLGGAAPAGIRLRRLFEALTAEPADTAGAADILRRAGVGAATVDGVVALLRDMVVLFRASQAVTEPEISGTAATVARFGFTSLTAEAIAALVATEGGGLRWLGAANNTKDFMHFEIRPGQQPPLK